MTHQLLNTLFVTRPDAYVRLELETLRVEAEGKELLQVPLHHLGAVVLFDTAMMSPQAMQRCVEEGREVVFLDFAGRFRCRVVGPTTGNVLLRAAQYEAHRDLVRARDLARVTVAAKIRNSRQTLLRGARDSRRPEDAQRLSQAAELLAALLESLPGQPTLDAVRGIEGQAGAIYFAVFGALITAPTEAFAFRLRTRRPPRDRVNALLSFVYSLLTYDCVGAAEGVGLDPQFGFLHALRPGRPALALDLMEEFRSCFADRLVLSLINLRQVQADDFEERQEGPTYMLTDEGRRTVLTAYQKRKQETVTHDLLKEPTPFGLVPHLQARLLARHLRGDIDEYPPYVSR
jgi:CRISPR-associated protein Cas1